VKSLAALCPAGAPTAITLGGEATWTAGSYTDTGTIALDAGAGGRSRVDLELAGGSRVSVRAPLNSHAGSPPGGAEQATGRLASAVGAEGAADGAVHKLRLGDAWRPAAWFFPALELTVALAPGYQLADLGTSDVDGVPAAHLRLTRAVPGQTPAMTAELAQLSQADYYLDPATLLPRALRFLRHPTGAVNSGEPVEIRYSDWRQVQGVKVPYHIERWVNGTLQLAVTVTSVEINPALAAERFQLQGAQ